ncbi:30S ribosomal protein S11 [Candidatus Gracilibacteria bacterium]|nr:30S ribosomal protein S11 [Candidatus Gracilibacteria bacterium]
MAKPTKKKIRKSFDHGIVNIRANYNNTIVTLSDPEGNVVGWSSPGANGYKGARQATPYAGQISAEKVAEKALALGMKTVEVYVKGMGPGRDQTVRGLMNGGLEVLSISDRTRVPHGGCRSCRIRKV